jgi:hypothetical protein
MAGKVSRADIAEWWRGLLEQERHVVSLRSVPSNEGNLTTEGPLDDAT